MRSHQSWLVVSCLSVLLCCWTGASAWRTRDVSNNNSYSLIKVAPPHVRSRDGEFEPKRQESGTNSSSSNGDLLKQGSVCAYRVLERGEDGRLCFRHARVNFTCPGSTCRQVRSPGGHLVANLLSNSTVLLQWTYPMVQDKSGHVLVNSEIPTEPTGSPPAPPKMPSVGQREPQGGFRMRCWWNGSYTQFECASVHLASGCRDYLLSELHENVPYRICLQPAVWDGPGECVEFSVSPTGMQDIVIAMMTVGGAICVMLVIICLLVAYITENIMSPNAQHTLAAQQHSRRSHNTYL
ncbi:fibronectin type III domain-containing protein 10 [Pangasianodon hypophthalmus]|uniref:fibronectin type III domain-containing protein 10 n=1 Tax=Pangasianodon hypophthalmus TaxID=310915 RepID=UPI0023076B2D|nr:fibronectin type III domain-containing protein 10 [Pangasianodon hypophthalmus]XP_053082888.1 fibronectin type III domain-containing protein 10 [Pangasianodon hypophthalmus]